MKITKILPVFAALFIGTTANGYVVFSDDFTSGASELWGNESGSWAASSGTYSATSPAAAPSCYSSLTSFDLTDFSISFTVNDVADGGVYLRSSGAGDGVVLITYPTYIYFLIIQSGIGGGNLSQTGEIYEANSDVDFIVTVIGNTYSVYVNGSSVAAATLTTEAFASGYIGLYDNSGQSFDNIVVATVPEPSQFALCGGALVVGIALLRRNKSVAKNNPKLTTRF